MKEAPLAKLFYKSAFAYEFLDTIAHFPDIYMKRWEKLFIPPGTGLLLELGCGTGRNSNIFNKKGVTVINFDINTSFVLYGKRNGRFRNPVVGSAYQLCFPDNIFDIVIIPDAFHHMLDHELVFKECYRVLKNGGEFIIFDIVGEKWAPDRIMSHFVDGIIWAMSKSFFLDKLSTLAENQGFEWSHFLEHPREKTLMGLMGGIDVEARFIKNDSGGE